MKKISLVTIVALAVLLIAAAVPSVSANTERLEHTGFDTVEYTVPKGGSTGTGSLGAGSIDIYRIEDFPHLSFLYLKSSDLRLEIAALLKTTPYYERNVTFSYAGTTLGKGKAYYNALWSGSEVIGVQCWFEIEEWDIGAYTGYAQVRVIPESGSLFNSISLYKTDTGESSITYPIKLRDNGVGSSIGRMAGYYLYHTTVEWYNDITTTDESVSLNRNIDGKTYPSEFILIMGDDQVYDSSNKNLKISTSTPYTWTVNNPFGKSFSGSGGSSGDIPGELESSVKIYVQNSQTGALLANANLVISANVNGNFHEVANETVPSGIYSIDLQPTGGGLPNPDFYRLITTAEGYNSIMPHIDFEVDGATSIYAYLDPIGGAPEDENNTFIDFFVRDMSANPISGATVNFGGYTLITNSAGYTIFEVDKSKTYSWTVSKSGYGSLTGNAVIGSNARHTINTVLAPAVTPTTPTAIPTSTSISPTPTMTAPTGEPTSNLLEWFAAHFGMILGGGVEIGKIFMWLCFAVPVGVYVGKEAKAGAAGFMAGAGIVTLFFVLIGWVPIWLLVLLALIIGLLYAKIFNNSDTGGGR